MKNKKILIIVTGSIAAYKSCEVIRLLRREGAVVQVMMSKSAQEFVGKRLDVWPRLVDRLFVRFADVDRN